MTAPGAPPPPAPPRRRYRSGAQRAVIAVNALALVAALVTAGVLAYFNYELSEVPRVRIPSSRQAADVEPGAPRNYLVVGIDDASDLPEDDPVRQARGSEMNTDTIMVLRIDPEEMDVQQVSIPRDLWVPISGTGTHAKINSALALGGPDLLARTITDVLGIPIHHYLGVNLAGFRELVEAVDGVPVYFPRPARSPRALFDIPEAGCWVLGPQQALGFARGRMDYQVQDSRGRWHTEPRSDHFRRERQQLFIRLALQRAIDKGARNLNTMRRLIDIGQEEAQADDRLTVDDLLTVGRAFRSFDPDDLVTHVLPVYDGTVGRASTVHLREAEAQPILDIFRNTGTETAGPPPRSVVVEVRNGAGVDGLAGAVTRDLVAFGFEAVVPSTVAATPRTTILHTEGDEAAARLVARHVTGPVRYEASDDLGAARVVLVVGADWEDVAAAARPADDVPGPATTTTAPPTTTTAPTVGTEPPGPGQSPPSTTEVLTDNPADPTFHQATAPPPGVDCRPTD